MGNNNPTMQNNTEEAFDFFKHQRNNLEMVQNILLIWLDINIVKNSDDYLKTITSLRSIVNTIKAYTDSEECIRFIKIMGNEKACILISGSVGQHIVPRIHDMLQVDSIFVFCSDLTRHRQWAAEWPKIHGVFTRLAPICEALKRVTEHYEQTTIPISLMATGNDVSNSNTSSNQLFIYTQILKEILFTIEFEQKHITEFCNRFRALLADNEDGLKNVTNLEKTYRAHSPIWWYTSDSFLRAMLNCALNQMNVKLFTRMGFFIGDLHRHIEQLYNEQFKDQHTDYSFTVYRGQGMTMNEFEQMKETKNGLISFNNFLSTNKNCDTSFKFAEFAAKNPNLVGVLFKMNIDPSNSTIPFAFIKNVSYHQDKDEVLFSMHTVFRLGDITSIDENHRIFQVSLTLTNDIDERIYGLTDRIREEIFSHSTGWYRLGLLLLKLGQYRQTEQIFETLLNQTADHYQKASIYNQIGKAKYAQGKYQEALRLYQQSFELYTRILPPIHLDLATTYYNIGSAYQNLNEHSQAILFHEKALQIRIQLLPPTHPDLASSYYEIGHAHFSMKEYQKALSFHDKALAIRENSLPLNHCDLVSSYDNIGEVYHSMKKYWKAISFYEKSLAIKQQLLPPNHPKLASSYNDIGQMCYKVREFTKALAFYEKALDILQRTQPPNFSDLITCYGKIGLMHENIGDYLKAHAAYEHAVNISEKALSLDHSLVHQQRKNLDRVKKQL
jgi:tetratricopeptide (TPR) repeat protein